MAEDIKVKVGADTKQVEAKFEQIKETAEKGVEFTIDGNFDTIKKQFENLKKIAEDVKMNPQNFNEGEITKIKSELQKCFALAQSNWLAGNNENAKQLAREIKSTATGLAKTKKEAKGIQAEFGLIGKAVSGIAMGFGLKLANELSKIPTIMLNAMKQGSALVQQLEQATKKTQTISNASAGEIGARLETMSKDTGIDERYLAEGLYQTITSIGDIAEKYELLNTANKIARTGFISVMEAVDGLTTVLNGYGLSLDNATRIADVFVKTQRYGKLTIDEFTKFLYKTVPLANTLGLSIENIGSSMALLTAKGSYSRVAQTQMAAFLQELAVDTTGLAKFAREAVGMSIDEYFKAGNQMSDFINQLKKYAEATNTNMYTVLNTKESQRYYNFMTDDLEMLRRKEQQVSGSTNQLETNYSNAMTTIISQTDRATQFVNAFKKSISGAVTSVVAGVASMITGYDRQLGATTSILNETQKYLETFQELAEKQNKTAQEQHLFNDALEQLGLLAPDVASAYKDFKNGAISYAEVLEIVAKKQKEIALGFANVSRATLVEQEKDYQKEKNKAFKSIFKAMEKDKNFDKSLITPQKDSRLGDSGLATISQANQTQAFRANFSEEKIKQLITSMQNGTGKQEAMEAYRQYKEYEKMLTETKKQIAQLDKNNEELINPTPKSVEPTAKAETKKDNSIVTFETESQVDAKFKKINNEALEQFVEQFEKANGVQQLALKETFEKAQKGRDYAYDMEKLKAQENALRAKLRNTNEDDTSVATVNLRKDLELNLEAQKKRELARRQELADLGYKAGRSSSTSKDKLDTSHIEREYQEKMLALTEKYYEALNELIATGQWHKLGRLESQYNDDKANIEHDKQQAILAYKADNAITAGEQKQIQLQIEQNQYNKDILDLTKQQNKQLTALNTTISNVNNMFQNLEYAINGLGGDGGSVVSSVGSILTNVTKGLESIRESSQDASGVVGALGSILNQKGTSAIITGASKIFEGLQAGTVAGNVAGAILGGQNTKENTIGSTIGSVAGSILGGSVGSIVGSVAGGLVGGLFGGSSRRKAKREAKKYENAQNALEEAQKTYADSWVEYVEQFAEELEKRGTGTYISMYDSLQGKTNEGTIYSKLKSNYQENKGYAYGVSMDTLRELLPQYTDSEIMSWFASQTGGASLTADGYLQTGYGKYGLFDLAGLAGQIANLNSDFVSNLKAKIKEVINFTADSIASTVSSGFMSGISDLGDNLEVLIGNSLKNAFLNTELSKSLFNGLSDHVSEEIQSMFKADGDLGTYLNTDGMESWTVTDYINAITQYMEQANTRLEDIFTSLGLSVDNLDESINSLNANLSRNTVQGMATNLWKYNAGETVNGITEITLNNYLGNELLDKRIIKVANDSLSKVRRGRY